MKTLKILGIAALFTATLYHKPAWAEEVTFAINATQSSLTATGESVSFVFQDQKPGSRQGRAAGTITVDITDSEIRLLNAYVKPVKSGTFQPGLYGAPGEALGQFGFLLDLSIFGEGYAALRDLEFTLDSLPIKTTTALNVSSITATTQAGGVDINLGFLGDSARENLTGSSAGNTAAGTGTLSQNSSTQTLSIPIDFTFSYGDFSYVRLAGTLVATRSLLPEPNPDFNGDCAVNGADYLVWQRNYGKTDATLADGDGNGDGTVNLADYTVWRDNYGAVIPGCGIGAPVALRESEEESEQIEVPATGSPESKLGLVRHYMQLYPQYFK